MSQRRIEVGSLLAHPATGLVVVRIAYLAHQTYAVGYHDQNDAHVLSKGEQQVTEVLALHHGVLLVEFLYALQAVQNACHGFTVVRPHLLRGNEACLHTRPEQHGQYSVAPESYLLDDGLGRAQTFHHGVLPEDVAAEGGLFDKSHEILAYALLVAVAQRRAYLSFYLVVQQQQFLTLRCRKIYPFGHVLVLDFTCKDKDFTPSWQKK